MWKICKNYPDYEVSTFGEIRNKENKNVLKIRYNNRGYSIVDLYKDKKRHTVLVHREVAFAFLEKHKSANQINHKDGNKSNNIVSNLEWVTQSENMKHAYATNLRKYSPYEVTEEYRRKMRNVGANIVHHSKEISVYDMNNKFIGIYESPKVAAEQLEMIYSYHFKVATIRNVANPNEKQSTYRSLVFRYTGNITDK